MGTAGFRVHICLSLIRIKLPVTLFWIPILRYLIIYSSEVIANFLASFIKVPSSGDYLSSSLVLVPWDSKSRISSLYNSTKEHIIRKSLLLFYLAFKSKC